MTITDYIRPAWTPITITLMILGFIISWPLGLIMLAYILWGDRLASAKTDLGKVSEKFGNKINVPSKKARSTVGQTPSGNLAFDEWREIELARIDEERRKLNDAVLEFEAYQRQLRRARDRDEFDSFMQQRGEREKPPRSEEL